MLWFDHVSAGQRWVRCSQIKFAVFQREMTAHLDEEESDVVPVMRKTFTQQEEQQVLSACLADAVLHTRRAHPLLRSCLVVCDSSEAGEQHELPTPSVMTLVSCQVINEMVKHMKKFDGASTFWHLPPKERAAFMTRVRLLQHSFN